MDELARQRDEMVTRQIAARGIADPRVLAAMGTVPRERFVPEDLRDLAYLDAALPLALEQTVSQPFVVALMAEALQLTTHQRVLEVGTGSGYAAAVLAELEVEVYTVERMAKLAELATRQLAATGYGQVHVRHGDGSRGWAEYAPYDAISVAAASPRVPAALLEQLAPGGRLVIPVGSDPERQRLYRITRLHDGALREEDLGGVAFVPLVGEEGWGSACPAG